MSVGKKAPLCIFGSPLNWLKLSKSAFTGIIATVVDMGLLALLVEVFSVPAIWANSVGLITGATIQFTGNKFLAFEGGKKRGLKHEILFFLLAEALSLGLNFFGFYFFMQWFKLNYIITRLIVTTAVFLGISYPIWFWIFDKGSKK